MRECDLIPAFLDVADSLRLSKADRATVRDIAKRLNADNYYDSDDSADDCSDLFDLLGNYCPAYTYFGAHEGDGADYGVWVSFESLEDDARNGGSIYKINAGEDFPKPNTTIADYLMVVTDHGNVTLYRKAGNRWIEEWSCV
jgi:hypothetical protein